MSIRAATLEDYELFTRFFAALEVPDPTPAPEWWARSAQNASFLELDGVPVAYANAYTLGDEVYVMHLVVDAAHRGRGVGRSMLAAVAARFPLARRWALYVKQDNATAIALYRRCGMSISQPVMNLTLRRDSIAALPASPVTVTPLADGEEAVLERALDLPAGRLARDRTLPGWRLFQAREGEVPVGLIGFDPAANAAWRLRARDAGVMRALFEAVAPEEATVRVNLEGRADLVDQLIALGAEVTLALFRMEGGLPMLAE